ncbi:MAG: hypothetical protein COA79_19070 [Planctomycetota bacterium]|nr:MAG: hypothetical protein COA79_19070 [Planctomycetota bacterium]
MTHRQIIEKHLKKTRVYLLLSGMLFILTSVASIELQSKNIANLSIMFFIIYAGLCLHTFIRIKCPKCKNRIWVNNLSATTFSNKCKNCNLNFDDNIK